MPDQPLSAQSTYTAADLEALKADAELSRKRGEWLTEAYERIKELEAALRRLDHLLAAPGGLSPGELQNEGLDIIRGVVSR